MLSRHKNEYLRTVCALDPRAIEKGVQRALRHKTQDLKPDKELDEHKTEVLPPLPTYFIRNTGVCCAQIGYGYEGLKILIRKIHSDNYNISLQAIQSILERIQISEDALFLIRNNVVDRIIDIMDFKNPLVRQQVCFILMHVSTYLQGRQKIVKRPIIIKNLLTMTLYDIEKDLRYSAAIAIRTLARSDGPTLDYVASESDIVPKLLKKIMREHSAIVIHHLKTLDAILDRYPAYGLRANAFDSMLNFLFNKNDKIFATSLDILARLCADPRGRVTADEKDLTIKLKNVIKHSAPSVIASALGLLTYTTLSERAKWRVREFCCSLPKLLINLCFRPNKPVIQLRAMQVLTNICDLPDIRNYLGDFDKVYTEGIEFRPAEKFKDGREVSSYTIETGVSYKYMARELTSILKKRKEDIKPEDVHSYQERLRISKKRLLYAIAQRPYDLDEDKLPKE